MLPTGRNEMIALDEFVVTFTDHTIPDGISWDQWYADNNCPRYVVLYDYKIAMRHMKKPNPEPNIIMPDNPHSKKPYEIVWAT